MLVEPEQDDERLALDRAVIAAVRDRLAAGARPRPDADAIAVRTLLAGGTDRREARILRGVLARIEAVGAGVPVCWGATAALLAADRYGGIPKIVAEPDEALAAVRMGQRAILEVQTARPWWGRLLAMPDLRIVAALPDDANDRPRAVLVARQATGPTGEDRTFWITDSTASDIRITEALAAQGLSASLLAATGGLKLFLLAGYVQAEDGRLTTAPGSLKGVIGAAPIF